MSYSVIDVRESGGGIIKCWDKHIPPIEQEAKNQMIALSKLPFIYKHIALMSDAHAGKGCCVGSVIATKKAIIPSAIGVDIGCGIRAVKTSLTLKDIPEYDSPNLKKLRLEIEKTIPHGWTSGRDKGIWQDPPDFCLLAWKNELEPGFLKICEKYPFLSKKDPVKSLSSLGSGNHYISINKDEDDYIWIMIHCGSRGIGNAIGQTFIELAKKDMEKWHIHLPDENLSYLPVGTDHFDDYWEALIWAQLYAKINRKIAMDLILSSIRKFSKNPNFEIQETVIDVHHNYCVKENINNENLFITRKGAIRARNGDLGVIPGAMGGHSYIVRGKGNLDSWNSASHGAGRLMSRNKAKQLISLDDHIKAMNGIECRLDEDVIDESPAAYKNIHDVIKSQEDLIETVHVLKEILSVKG